jgi:hypothetical protein
MVCNRGCRSNDQNLGFSKRNIEIDFNGSHISRTRSKCTCNPYHNAKSTNFLVLASRVPTTSLPFLLRRRQDGEVLGSGNKQSYSTLPRPFKRCLYPRSSPNPRCTGDRRTRRSSASVGHEDAHKRSRNGWPQGDGLRPEMSRSRSSGHHRIHGFNNPALGFSSK